MKKAVHNCATGQVEIIEMTEAEVAKVVSSFGPQPVPPTAPSAEDRIKELEARLAALEAKQQ